MPRQTLGEIDREFFQLKVTVSFTAVVPTYTGRTPCGRPRPEASVEDAASMQRYEEEGFDNPENLLMALEEAGLLDIHAEISTNAKGNAK